MERDFHVVSLGMNRAFFFDSNSADFSELEYRKRKPIKTGNINFLIALNYSCGCNEFATAGNIEITTLFSEQINLWLIATLQHKCLFAS
jgi:hypothetical protein